MIPEFGHFSMVLSTIAALVAAGCVLAGLRANSAYFREMWRPGCLIVAVTVTLAVASLVYAFVTDDFSVRYVTDHSNSGLALEYKVAALWGSHEGSFLLWVWLIGIWTAIASRRLSVKDPDAPVAQFAGVALAVVGSFSLFLLLTSNPFARLLPLVPPDGRDLNPMLQDVGMVLHPPLLFMGYAGLCVLFAAVSALLLRGKWSESMLDFMMRQSMLTWIFLTAGNALGSWWAYNELGWGGWWFWDPVENASFIPWLLCSAMLHVLIMLRVRGQMAGCALALSLGGFTVCLVGSFLVRSGMVQSVHAFAQDPARGTAMLILFGALLVPAALLFALRGEKLLTTDNEIGNEDLIVIGGIYILVASAICVLFGTLYPLIYDMLGLGKVTVGAPYFNSFFAPMTCLVAGLIGFAHLGNRRDWRLVVALVVTVVVAVAVPVLFPSRHPEYVLMGAASSAWLVICVVLRMADTGRRTLSFAAVIAHLGLAVSIIGATGASNFETEAVVRMGPDQGRPMSDIVFVYRETRHVSERSYTAQEGVIEVLDAKTEKVLETLRPQRQTYRANGMQMTAAGISHGLLRDLYVSMGNPLSETEYLVRLSIKPLVSWIWGGAVLMILGGALSLVRRRRFVRKESGNE